MDLTPNQIEILDFPLDKKLLIRGEAGTGKTSVAVKRLQRLLNEGFPAESILILLPQRPLAWPYTRALSDPNLPPGGRVSILTIGGLARRMDELFWPLIAEKAGFTHPEIPPQFLTVETTQYFLSLIVDPLREQGYFEGIAIEPIRLYSQILDNLNKTAVVGFPPYEIAQRLRSAWTGNQADARYFDQAQECAVQFRKYCLEHSLLDFSLQLEVFAHLLWKDDIFQRYILGRYRHLIYDNVEEDYPTAHDIMREWINGFESAMLIMDEFAGYRSFLGADPISASSLSDHTDKTFRLTETFNVSKSLRVFSGQLRANLRQESSTITDLQLPLSNIFMQYNRFVPQMLDNVVCSIKTHIQQGQKSGDIVILAPYVSDALRFSLQNRLDKEGISLTTHRPGRELRNEPAVRCLFTLAKLAYPSWNLKVPSLEFRAALMTAISGLDMLRADLLAGIVLSHKREDEPLNSFSAVKPEMAERITYQIGEKYETLRSWILNCRQNDPMELTAFFSRCFGELLSQKGFGFHSSYDMADATERLIESAREFESVIKPTIPSETAGAQFLDLMQGGITGAQHLASWQDERPDAVLLSPAFTFLMRNQPASVQIWLDPGNTGWWERLNQPLTHPVVLSRNWPSEARWTDAEEINHNLNSLIAHTTGLINRCSGRLEIFLVDIDEQGNEPRGPLLQAINRFLRYHPGGIEQL